MEMPTGIHLVVDGDVWVPDDGCYGLIVGERSEERDDGNKDHEALGHWGVCEACGFDPTRGVEQDEL